MSKNIYDKSLGEMSVEILTHFGHVPQMLKCIEELGELTTQLAKRLNEKAVPTTADRIIDEVADALVMLNQMRLIFGAKLVDERVEFKLKRTLQRIKSRDEMPGSTL